jgi:hypothetical protein
MKLIKRRNEMKRWIKGCMLLLFVALISPQAFGDTIPFGDHSIYWSGWAAKRGGNDQGMDNFLNTYDFYSIPNILGGSATVNNGYVTKVTFQVNIPAGTAGSWGLLKPADLFIDTNHDQKWDYVVNMIAPNDVPGDGKLYAITQPLGSKTGYFMSYVINKPYYDVRYDHPIGVDLSLVGGSLTSIPVTFSGWSNPGDGKTTDVSFVFGGLGIPVGYQFDIGWTVNCANDVIYENIYVPEPTTLLFLGCSIIVLVGFGRKRLFAKLQIRTSN